MRHISRLKTELGAALAALCLLNPAVFGAQSRSRPGSASASGAALPGAVSLQGVGLLGLDLGPLVAAPSAALPHTLEIPRQAAAEAPAALAAPAAPVAEDAGAPPQAEAAAQAAKSPEKEAPQAGLLGGLARHAAAVAPSEQGKTPTAEQSAAENSAFFDHFRAVDAPESAVAAVEAPFLTSGLLGRGEAVSAQDAARTSGEILGLLLEESPALRETLERNIAQSAYGALFAQDWKADAARALAPWLRLQSGLRGFDSLADLSRHLRQDGGRMERAELAAMLAHSNQHETEEWTYLFRDYPLWAKTLPAYLDQLIGARKAAGTRSIEVLSGGTAYGSESYTLAIMVEAALRRAGEDPGDWDVAIRTYDISLLSLLSAGKGLYRPASRDAFIRKHLNIGTENHFEETSVAGTWRLRAPLRDWIKPGYVDLNDMYQHELLFQRRPDVLFMNYVLYHLQLKPAAALGDYLMSGDWARGRRAFFSFSQTVLGEMNSPLAPSPWRGIGSFIDNYEGNTGWRGRNYFGQSLGIYGWRMGLRNLWRRLRYGVARRTLGLGEAFQARLRADALGSSPADPGLVEFLASFGREHSLRIDLDSSGILAHLDQERRVLNVDIGWIMAGPETAERRELLGRLLAEEVARVGLPGPAGPKERPWLYDHPELGVGHVVLSGYRPDGALLKVGVFAGKTVAFWQTRRLVPLASAYYSDNASKLLDPDRPKASDQPQKISPRVLW